MRVYLWTPSNNGNDFKTEDRDRGINRLKNMGYEITIDDCVNQDYLGLGINHRSKLIEFFDRFSKDNNSIIIPYYGGLTSNRILDDIVHFADKLTNQLVCGKSDLTNVLNVLYKVTGQVCLYGIDLSKISNPHLTARELEIIKKSLNKEEFMFNCPKEYNDGYWYVGERETFEHGRWGYFYEGGEVSKISGISVGGNLDSLCILLGTNYSPDFKDKLVVLETVSDVSPRTFLRNLKHLIMGSNIMDAQAIIVGKFAPKSLLNDKNVLYQLFIDELNIQDIPIVYNVDFSHTEPSYPFYIGGKLHIDLETQVIKVSTNS